MNQTGGKDDYQKYMKQQGGDDYQKYMKTNGSDDQKGQYMDKYAGDYKKYENKGGDYKTYENKGGDYQKYMKQSGTDTVALGEDAAAHDVPVNLASAEEQAPATSWTVILAGAAGVPLGVVAMSFVLGAGRPKSPEVSQKTGEYVPPGSYV